MKSGDPEINRKVAQWIEYANEDLLFAEHGLKLGSDTPNRLVTYHAQQCAEKYLKGFLVLIGVDFPYTHNISTLLEIISYHAGWADELRDAEELSQFAVTVRYPGEAEYVDREEALRSIELARSVKAVVERAIIQAGPVHPEE